MIKHVYRFLSPRFQNLFLDYPVKFKPRYGHGAPPHPELYALIDRNRERYAQRLKESLDHLDVFAGIRDLRSEKDLRRPAYNNGFLPGLDMVGIFQMIAEFKPGQYVEIGSGHSTRMAHLARELASPQTRIISIDPAPRAEMDQLADQIVRKPFEDTDPGFLENLREGDILFVDNSHRILPNSDAMVFFLEVMPRLAKGVIVHIHDIYLPYDYPPFMCDRFYSEQYGLAMYLLANPAKFEVLFPNYFISEDAGLAAILTPLWEHPALKGVERHGGSFWFRIVA